MILDEHNFRDDMRMKPFHRRLSKDKKKEDRGHGAPPSSGKTSHVFGLDDSASTIHRAPHTLLPLRIIGHQILPAMGTSAVERRPRLALDICSCRDKGMLCLCNNKAWQWLHKSLKAIGNSNHSPSTFIAVSCSASVSCRCCAQARQAFSAPHA